MRGYGSSGAAEAIRQAGGRIFGVTSEPQTLAREAEASWELDFPTLGDPHHEIANACRERGWLDLFVNPHVDFLNKNSPWIAHPRGYFQPGVLAIHRDGRILYRWRSVPKRSNAGGAGDRPEAPHVWSSIERALAEPTASDAELDTPPSVDMKTPPWPFYVALQLANGNFLGPKGFELDRGAPIADLDRGTLSALIKLVLFVAAWIAAFATLPLLWVLAALVSWGLFVRRPIAVMRRDFQFWEDL